MGGICALAPEAMTILSALIVSVPTCITMIVLGEVANVSVGNLFFAGIGPAVVMALGLMLVIYLEARRGNLPVDAADHQPD